MKSMHLLLRHPSCLLHSFISPAGLAGAALLIGITSSRLWADPGGLAPTIEFTQDLLGQQVCLQWNAQPGVQYVVQKSAGLGAQGSPGGFATVALVTAESAACQWVDPEAATTRGFYRIGIPQPKVFALEPAVIPASGGDIFVRGQCLPAGSSLVLEIPGQAPLSVPLEPVTDQPGLWRVGISAGAVAGIVVGAVIATRVVDINGTTVAPVDQTVEVTETGQASDAPPWLPPAAPVSQSDPIPGVGIVIKNLKPKKIRHRLAGGEEEVEPVDSDGDMPGDHLTRKGYQYYMAKSDLSSAGAHTNPLYNDEGTGGHNPLFEGSHSLLMPALMKAKEKANRTKCANNLRQLSFSSALPGELTAEQCDLALAAPAGPPLEWVRCYRSKFPGGFQGSGHGPGWSFSYDISIEPVPLAAGVKAPVVIVRDGSGREDKFERQGDGTYRCHGIFREGRFNPDTSFTLTFADKGTWIFCALVGAPWSGRIGSITDHNGVALNFTYNNGQLATVSDAFGRSLSVTWSSTGQISRVADSTGRSVSYAYYSDETGGSAGDLKSVSCPQVAGQAPVCGPTTFTYTSGFSDGRLNHNLTSATDGAGRNLGAFTYSVATSPADLEFDTVASVGQGSADQGHMTHIKIAPVPGGSDPSAAYVIYENDELGRVTETTCDRMHRPTSVREYTGFARPGAPVTATANRPTGKLRTNDPDFYQTTFLYNSQHLCTRVTMPDGMQERTTYEYDLNPACPPGERANRRVCTLVAPDGGKRTVSMEYLPGFGSPESHRFGTGLARITPKIAKESHGKFRLPLLNYASIEQASIRMKIGAAGYKSAEDLAIRIIQDGNCEEAEFQDIVHSGTGTARGVDRDGKDCTNPGRPKLGHVTRMTTSLGQVFTWSYDTAGNCTSSRTPIAGAGCDIVYNTLGQVTSITTLNGPGSSFTDTCVYDAATRFCSSIISDSQGLQLTTSCTRDALGRITGITDPRGFETLFTYNLLDECVTGQSPPVGTTATRITTTCFYDAGGLPSGFDIEHRDATGALVAANPAYSVRYLRESPSRPRLISRVAVENRPVALPPGSTDLNSVGLANFDVSDFLFDAAGQIIQESTPAACRAQPTDSVSRYEYDERGLLLRSIDGQAGLPDSVTTTTECDYTPAGLLQRWVTLAASGGVPDEKNPSATFTYDGFRRFTSSTDTMGNVRTFTYDNQGNVTCSLHGELDDAVGSAKNVLLSSCRLKVWQLMQGQHGTAQGLKTEWITSMDLPKITPKIAKESHGRFRMAFFDYFVEDDVMTVDRFTPGAATPTAQETTTVNRSPAGLVMSIGTNGDTLATNTYDSAGRLIACGNSASSVAYALDAGGNVLSSTRTDFPSGSGNPVVSRVRVATYDALGRAVQVSERANVATWQYDSLSRETCFQPPVGAPVYSSYDGTGTSGPYSVLTQCDVDGNGSLETLGSSYARSCPKRYRIRIHTGPPRPPIFGRSVTNSNGHTTTFTLDSQDRCVRTDFPDGTFETNTFNSLGHLVVHKRRNGAVIAADFDYRERARLVTCTDPNPGVVPVPPVSFLYNGLDDCIRMTQGKSDIVRAFDSCGNLVSESQNGHVVQHTYTHLGRRTGTTYPGGARFNESRNAQGLLVSVAAEGAGGTPIASIQYLGYRPAQETRRNGVVTTFVYRGVNDPPLPGTGPDFSIDTCVQRLVTGPTGNVLSRSFFTRDAHQQLIRRETLFEDGPNTKVPLRRQLITRDRLGRPTRMVTGARLTDGAAITPESDVTYTLDPGGRRLSATGGAHPGAYTSSDSIPPGDLQMEQYSSWPGGSLTWDDNGNLTLLSDGAAASRQFAYDACSRLVAVVDPNTGGTVANFSYDACGRLISSTVPNSNAALPPVSTFYLYDGNTCIQELNELGQPQMTFAAMGLCIIPINGDPIYPHGSSSFLSRSIKQGHYAVSNFHIEVDGASGGYLSSYQVPSYEVEDVAKCLTGGTGTALEHFDFDDGGQPVFLTGEGVVRPRAGSSLSGYRWMAPECLWSPESGLFHRPGGAFSPALGQGVATESMEFMVEDFRYVVGHK